MLKAQLNKNYIRDPPLSLIKREAGREFFQNIAILLPANQKLKLGTNSFVINIPICIGLDITTIFDYHSHPMKALNLEASHFYKLSLNLLALSHNI